MANATTVARSPRKAGTASLVLAVVLGALMWCQSQVASQSQDAFAGSAAPSLRARRETRVVARWAASAETMGKVADVVSEQLGVDKDKVLGTATLSELGADSLDIVETVMALEEAFDVELPDEETTQLKNVQDVADLIQSKI